ncbi:MAG: hypothetical protein SFV18_15630 [Bryobacteraceae bacterium]|nr:hypothetical protein [Bryobacteraceae bacterium]
MERFLRETIVECSRHRPANASSLYEMEARAWLIDVKTKNGRVGFVKPTERKPNDDIHYADPVADRF